MRNWLIALGLVLMLPVPARAAESAAVTSARASVSLVSESDSYRPGAVTRLGLRFRLAPGWHIYWQNPGDAGSPPDVTWTLPAGARAGEIEWPAPVREDEGPVVSYVYTGALVLPVALTPPAGSAPLAVEAAASWLVCEKICVPEQGRFSLTLPAGTGAPGALAAEFAAADARQPRPSPFAATVAPDGTLRVAGPEISPRAVSDAWFFPAAWGGIDQNAPQPLAVREGALTLRLTPGAQFDPAKGLDGLLVLHDPKGDESFLTVKAAAGAAAMEVPGPEQVGVVRALLLALAGGLILNLMPCVFPVLAMKALGLARLSGGERRTVRAHALSYTAGC